MQKNVLIVLLAVLFSCPANAVGPQTMAKFDRSTWPEPIDSPTAFDRASRAEILVFTAQLDAIAALSEAELKQSLGIKFADVPSVRQTRQRLLGKLWANFKLASKSCHTAADFCSSADTPEALLSSSHALDSLVPSNLRPWYLQSQATYRIYAQELIRLAALFPRVSSEIAQYDPLERDGFELADKHFVLTFDDGPTDKNGSSDVLIGILDRLQLNGVFFVLGERLQGRSHQQDPLELQQLYRNQCVGLHGWKHESHAKWPRWQESVTDTQKLIKALLPASYSAYFRPPYGQRKTDSAQFFRDQQLGVALWNIDSQDWSSTVSAKDAEQRSLSLMLLWRRGVLLFHDVHSKAQQALPPLIKQLSNSGIVWEDCHHF